MDVAQRILQRVEEFPTLPTVYSALSEVIANPRSTASDAAQVISTDQASAAKILKAANSPLYGYSGRIDTISKAIFFIGFNEVRNLVAALSIIDMFGKGKQSILFNPVEFWKYSIATGVITRLLGKQAGVSNLENFFLAGILHSIGKLFFYEFVPREYSVVLNMVSEKQAVMRIAEREVLGTTHTAIGELLAEKWQLPPSIKNTIKNYISGFNEGKPDLQTASVHIASIMARCLCLGNPGDLVIPQPNEQVWDVLRLPKGTITGLHDQIQHDYQEAASSLLL